MNMMTKGVSKYCIIHDNDVQVYYLASQCEDAGNGPEWGVIDIEKQSDLQGEKCNHLSTYLKQLHSYHGNYQYTYTIIIL